MSEWQDIESAPRDKTWIIACVAGTKWAVVMRYIPAPGHWQDWRGDTPRIAPTHWQPLPEPPGVYPARWESHGNPVCTTADLLPPPPAGG